MILLTIFILAAWLTNKNTVFIGPPGVGKSKTLVNLACQYIGKAAIYLATRSKTTAYDLLEQVIHRYPWVIVDDLDCEEAVVGCEFLKRHEGEKKRRRAIEGLIDICGRDSEKPIVELPLKYRYSRLAIEAFMMLPVEVQEAITVSRLHRIIKGNDEVREIVVDNLPDSEQKRDLMQLGILHPATALNEAGSAFRMLESHLNQPAVRMRNVKMRFGFNDIIDNKVVFITTGGTKAEFRAVTGIRQQELLQLENNNPLLIILEEPFVERTFNDTERVSILENRKQSTAIWVTAHTLPVDEEMFRVLDQGFGRFYLFRQNSWSMAQWAAFKMNYDRNKVHHYDKRQFSDGYDLVNTSSTGMSDGESTRWLEEENQRTTTQNRSITEGETHLARQRIEMVPVYEKHDSQHFYKAQKLMELAIGQYVLVENGNVQIRKDKLPMGLTPWPNLTKKRLQSWLHGRRASAVYATPATLPDLSSLLKDVKQTRSKSRGSTGSLPDSWCSLD